MIFDIEKQDEGDWFEFFNSRVDPKTGEIIYEDPEPDAARFRVRSTTPFWEETRRNRKKKYEMVLNPSTRAMERVGYYDMSPEQDQEETDGAWDYAITGIENVFSATGAKVDCTRENKLKLIKIPAFLRFITRVFEIISESSIKQKEASEKN